MNWNPVYTALKGRTVKTFSFVHMLGGIELRVVLDNDEVVWFPLLEYEPEVQQANKKCLLDVFGAPR